MKRYFYYIALIRTDDNKEHVIHGTAHFNHKTARCKYTAISRHLMKEYNVPFSEVAISSLEEIDKEDFETLQTLK